MILMNSLELNASLYYIIIYFFFITHNRVFGSAELEILTEIRGRKESA